MASKSNASAAEKTPIYTDSASINEWLVDNHLQPATDPTTGRWEAFDDFDVKEDFCILLEQDIRDLAKAFPANQQPRFFRAVANITRNMGDNYIWTAAGEAPCEFAVRHHEEWIDKEFPQPQPPPAGGQRKRRRKKHKSRRRRKRKNKRSRKHRK